MPTANVNSIVAVREFKAALNQFAEEASSALDAMAGQIHRALDWVEHERPAYWQQQIRLAFDDVAETRTRLNTCQMHTVAGQRRACIEEKLDHERAKKRLAYCQQMVPLVKRWTVTLRHEADEYRGRMGRLTRAVEIDLPRMIALIERTAAALEQYAEVAAEPVDLRSPVSDADSFGEGSPTDSETGGATP